MVAVEMPELSSLFRLGGQVALVTGAGLRVDGGWTAQ